VNQTSNPAALDKLKLRIQALRAKTIANGCTEDEALSAAAKVAELLDRHDLSLSDVELRASPCERRVYETHRKKRIPLDDCIGAIAHSAIVGSGARRTRPARAAMCSSVSVRISRSRIIWPN
jgi:hypothetical protein